MSCADNRRRLQRLSAAHRRVVVGNLSLAAAGLAQLLGFVVAVAAVAVGAAWAALKAVRWVVAMFALVGALVGVPQARADEGLLDSLRELTVEELLARMEVPAPAEEVPAEEEEEEDLLRPRVNRSVATILGGDLDGDAIRGLSAPLIAIPARYGEGHAYQVSLLVLDEAGGVSLSRTIGWWFWPGDRLAEGRAGIGIARPYDFDGPISQGWRPVLWIGLVL